MSVNLSFVEFPFDTRGLVLVGYRGSIAHGTYMPKESDDKDILGAIIPPKEYIYGLHQFEQKEYQKDEWDILIYEIRKFIRLLLNSNPNVLSLLWLRENHYIIRTELGQRLIDNRDIFISKLLYKTFGGYAIAQMRKMEHGKPLGNIGAKRREILNQKGYDPKNASHLIRLLKMGIEVLTTGEIQVLRPDGQMLLAIKNGEWTLTQIKNEAERLNKLLDEAFIRSTLPTKPNYEKAEKLLMGIIEDFWK